MAVWDNVAIPGQPTEVRLEFAVSLDDPSYGIGAYGGEAAHENAAIDGIYDAAKCKKNDVGQELDYDRDAAKE